MVDLAYQQSVQPEGPPGRAYPRLPEEVPPGAFGGEIGRSVEAVGEAEQQHADAAMNRARQTQYAEGDNALQALSQQLTHDPKNGAFTKLGKNAFGLDQQYLPTFDQGAQNIIANTPDIRVREQLQKAYQQHRVNLSTQLDAHEIAQHKVYEASTYTDAVKLASQAAVSNYNNASLIDQNLSKIDGSLASLADSQGWSAEHFAEARYEARAGVHQGVLDSMIADGKIDLARTYYEHVKSELKGPEVKAFQQAIDAGQVKASANQILSQYRIDTGAGAKAFTALEYDPRLSDEQRTAVIRAVDQGRNQLALERQQDPQVHRELTGITDAIALGQTDGGTLASLERLYRQGAVTDSQHLAYRDAIERAQKKQDGTQAFLDQARQAYDNRTHLDPENKDAKLAADALMGVTAPGQRPGSQGYNTAALEITSRIGVIPSQVVSFGRANLLGGDPRAAAAAANLFSELHENNSYAYQLAIDEKTRAVADTIARAVGSGMDPEKVVEMARENAQLSGPERSELDKQWSKRYPATQAPKMDAQALSKALASDPLYSGPGKFAIAGHEFLRPGVPDASPALMAEFDSLTHEYFLHTGGNLQQSQELAARDLKGTWGVSEVNGTRELMKYAPERMVLGLTAQMIRSDLAASGHGDAHLVETPETGRSHGQIWNLSQKDEFGAYDVVRDKQGRPLRYQLPAVKAAAAAAQASTEAADKAKLADEQRRQQQAEQVAVSASLRH